MLDRQRRFLQDAAHELRTPITVALGHTELVERAVADPAIAADAKVASDELMRLRRLATRLLLLASADGPDFLDVTSIPVRELLAEALERWDHAPRRWSLGSPATGWPRRASRRPPPADLAHSSAPGRPGRATWWVYACLSDLPQMGAETQEDV